MPKQEEEKRKAVFQPGFCPREQSVIHAGLLGFDAGNWPDFRNQKKRRDFVLKLLMLK